MPTTADFLIYTQWLGITTLVLAAITALGFILNWSFRFRLVGATGFLGVLTAGLFALSLVPFTRTAIPGAVRFSLVYDNGSNQTVISVPSTITETQLEATLRQAASNLYSYGRVGRSQEQLTIRARTIIHPEPGVSKPLYIATMKRSLAVRDDDKMEIEIFPEQLAQLPQQSK